MNRSVSDRAPESFRSHRSNRMGSIILAILLLSTIVMNVSSAFSASHRHRHAATSAHGHGLHSTQRHGESLCRTPHRANHDATHRARHNRGSRPTHRKNLGHRKHHRRHLRKRHSARQRGRAFRPICRRAPGAASRIKDTVPPFISITKPAAGRQRPSNHARDRRGLG